MRHLLNFINDEGGAITIEWVVLAAGVVLLALGVIAVLDTALESVASNIAATIGDVTSDTLASATTG